MEVVVTHQLNTKIVTEKLNTSTLFHKKAREKKI